MSEDIEVKLLQLKQAIKNASGNITDEIKDLIEQITSKRGSSEVKKLQSLVGRQIDNESILSSIGNIQQPDIVTRTIKQTLTSVINPTKMSFAREIPKFIDALSYDKEITKTIPRTVPKNTLIEISQSAKSVQFSKMYPNAPNTEKVINPDFKQLLSTGYKPEDASKYQEIATKIGENNPFLSIALTTGPSGSAELGTPESDYLKNGIGGDEPSLKKEKITTSMQIQAALLVDSFNNIAENISSSIDNNNFKIKISGKLNSNNRIVKLIPSDLGNMAPSWNINYAENNNKYFLNIRSNVKYSKRSGLMPNSSSIRFVGNMSEFSGKMLGISDADNEAVESRFSELNVQRDACDLQINDELFSSILIDKLGGKLEQNKRSMNAAEKKALVSYIKSKYKELLDGFIADIFTNIANNRLLQQYQPSTPPVSFGTGEDDQRHKLTLLGLVNFLPETPQELKDCGKNLHPLNLDEATELMFKKFNSVGLKSVPPDESEEEENPISEAVSFGAMLMLIRLYSFEYLLRNLIIFDELGYNANLYNSPIIKEYLSIMTKKELQDLKLYDSIELTIEKNYNFLKQEKIILPEDELESSITANVSFNNSTFDLPNQKFKNLLSAMLRKNVGFVRNLLGAKSEEIRTEADIMSSGEIYNVFNIKNTETSKVFFDISNKKQRFQKFRNRNTFQVLEKYIKSSSFSNKLFKDPEANIKCNNDLRNSGGMAITSFEEYSSFIYDFINEPKKYLKEEYLNEYAKDILKNSPTPASLQSKIDSFFTVPLAIGIRITFIKKEDQYLFNGIKAESVSSPLFGLNSIAANTPENLAIRNFAIFHQNRDTKFYITENRQNSVKVMKQYIKNERAYSFFEGTKNENGELVAIYYNSLPIVEQEIQISFQEIFNSTTPSSKEEILKRIENIFESKKQKLIKELSKKPDYQLTIKRSLSADKIINLLCFYSDRALATEEIENLFKSTKKSIKRMIKYSENIDDYAYRDEDEISGGDAEMYQKDLADVGNPNPLNIDLLWFLLTTPILIFKGLLQIMDPNIAIASQIVNVWEAGLLTPKLDEDGNIIEYPSSPPFPMPTIIPSLALLPPTVFPPPIGIGIPVTPLGMIFWALEPLLWRFPYYQNKLSKNASSELKNNPNNRGLSLGAGSNFSCDKNQDEV